MILTKKSSFNERFNVVGYRLSIIDRHSPKVKIRVFVKGAKTLNDASDKAGKALSRKVITNANGSKKFFKDALIMTDFNFVRGKKR